MSEATARSVCCPLLPRGRQFNEYTPATLLRTRPIRRFPSKKPTEEMGERELAMT
jgi:hypothetical protein